MTQATRCLGHSLEPFRRDRIAVDPTPNVFCRDAQRERKLSNADPTDDGSEEHGALFDTLRDGTQVEECHDQCQSVVSKTRMTETPADRLRSAREKRRITRAQLSAKLGVGQSTIRAHENGQNGILPAMAGQYAAELGVSPQWILYGAEDVSDRQQQDPPPRIFEIPVVGRVRPGYFPDARDNEGLGTLPLAIPGYDRFRLKAYAGSGREAFSSYVICAPWEGDALYLVDEVVLRVVKGDLAEIDVWRVGAAPGWLVFYKGPSQSQASDLIKLRPNGDTHTGLTDKIWVLGLVIGHLEYLPHTKIRSFEFPEDASRPVS